MVYPDAFCQAARPCSAMNRRWRSRCVGAVSLGRVARHRARARRHDHLGIRMPCRDLGVDVVPIERAVAGEGGDGTIRPVEQGADLRAVVDIVGGRRRRDDPAGVGVHADVEKLWGGGEAKHHRRRTQADGDAPCHSRMT